MHQQQQQRRKPQYDNGGIIYVEVQQRPNIGEVCIGYKLREAYRGCGFNQTDEEVACRVTHIINTKHVKTGFYVVGNQCPLPKDYN